jgi:hypothetical protein
MGAWGREPFENDGAHDWLFTRNAAPDDLTACRAAFEGVVDNPAYLEVDEGQAVIAAAALMASGVDGDRSKTPPELDWRGDPPSSADRVLAVQALNRVLQAPTSEIAELWDEAPEGALWRVGVAALRARLSR